jgi:hypothetical protein
MSRSSMTEILNEAQVLLVQTYNRNELRQLLRSRMDIDLDNIAPNATGNTDLAFEVLTWMDRRRRVRELVHAACLERPTVPEWRLLLERIAPPPDQQKNVTAPVAPEVVPLPRASAPPDEVRALVRGYVRLRRALPDGDQKTVQLQSLVNQLLALPLDEHELADRFHLSESDGERLVAVLTLVRRTDTRYLRWLAERVAVESHFVGYQAAVALEVAAKTLPVLDLDAVMTAVECARRWIPQQDRQDKGRWKKLGQTIEVITRRSAGEVHPTATT